MSSLDDALRLAHHLADRAAGAIEGKPVNVTRRKIFAGAAFQLSIEHHRAVIILVENGVIGSALALLRPVIEAFALGYWLCYIASDEDLNRFAEGLSRPKLSYLLRMLVEHNPEGPTHEVMKLLTSRAHDLTHGGVGHLLRRMNSTRLGPTYQVPEVVISLNVATWVASMATLDLVGAVIEDSNLASALTDELRAIVDALPDTSGAASAPGSGVG